MKQLEDIILDYFKLINPHHYDEVDIRGDLLKSMGLIFITIRCKEIKHSHVYFGRKGRERTVTERLQDDMEDMFPYCFRIHCKL